MAALTMRRWGLTGVRQSVAHEVHAANLPAGLQDVGCCRPDSLLTVAGHELDATKSTPAQAAQEFRPERLGLAGKHGALMDEAENDALAFMTFPRAHWSQIYSTNPLERLDAEIKWGTNVVGIFPNDAVIVLVVGAMMLEQNDKWSRTGASLGMNWVERNQELSCA